MKDFFNPILKAPAKRYEDVIIIVCHDFTLHENQSENQNGTVTRDACDNQTLTVFVASTLYKESFRSVSFNWWVATQKWVADFI